MKKKLLALCLTLALLCGAGALAAGESYSFPAAGVFVEPAEGWQLFSPETLDAAGETLTRLGADADVRRADWAAAGTVFPFSFGRTACTAADKKMPHTVHQKNAHHQHTKDQHTA